jgi:CBS-domain-containing membrane protein
MFSIATRAAARPIVARSSGVSSTLCRSMATVKEGLTATDAWSKSCYSGIDYTINEDLPVYDAVTKFAAYNVGCLVTVDSTGAISGVVSERDYVCKIALLGKTSKETKVKGTSLCCYTLLLYISAFIPHFIVG